jgi:hypothetical protein
MVTRRDIAAALAPILTGLGLAWVIHRYADNPLDNPDTEE